MSCQCAGCNLLPKLPKALLSGVEVCAFWAEVKMTRWPRQRLEEAVKDAGEASVDGVMMADWVVTRSPRPKNAKSVMAPLGRLVAALHLLHKLDG